ncbi:MAG TPA: hypothetical protein GX523_15520 [Desulfitobacterium dehalogenans]|uniref:Uncharacterized protein n=1 Tax=Desulfitobacterium dehalogenans TaxID=36854 RepID=A0A7C6Z694_9FIRM|nr:hypothetical protein [Desulfitobacterium dehalogenans]
MLHMVRNKFNTISNRVKQNLTGTAIGLTAALLPLQRSGCSGNCKLCQSCTASAIIIAGLLLTKFRGRVQKIFPKK